MYNKIRKIKTITATITLKIEQTKELTVKSKKSSTGFLLSEVQIGANEAKKIFSMLFAIFILLQKDEQVRTLSSLVVNMQFLRVIYLFRRKESYYAKFRAQSQMF